ncbi:hypothetical protein [Paenibacillus mendelii]|uniref:Flagellar hook-length control protein-like C-terminal domain-containing protein n=1 Tax=Paenibacillus mendelii TaxID=206163 RepID=A0ABV6JGX8_9BACL|nr:hypothetical protein [Paenibacillus mendelii]MCQ6557937.1 hypothetical protein [Paenibacillus mendelii]
MNIGQLMRGLLGDAQAADGKALELKVGQIVRGTIVQMMDNQEAIVQINGTQVRAKLETLLQAGQSTLLQVQPQSAGGQLVLKMVDQQAGAMPPERLMEWLKALGLPDQKWAGDLVRELRREGLTLTRELSTQFQQAVAAKPPGVDAQTYMQAAAVAVKRGLPMTEAVIGAIRQALSGPPAHKLMESLEQGLSAWRGSTSDGGGGSTGGTNTASQALVSRALALFGEGAAIMRNAASGQAVPVTGTAGSPASAQTGGIVSGQGAGASLGAAPTSGAGAAVGSAGASLTTAAGPSAAANSAAGIASAAAKQGNGAPAVGESTRPFAAQSSNTASVAAAAGAAAASSDTPSSGGGASRTANGSSNWINGLMKWLGVDHERLLAQSVLSSGTQADKSSDADSGKTNAAESRTQAQFPAGTSNSTASSDRGAGGGAQGERIQAHTVMSAPIPQVGVALENSSMPDPAKVSADTLKSVLMSLAASDDIPPSLKETAQQLVQQITGQQLMLSQERNGSPFTHVTMFIPMQGPDGGQTASVHIQTRRGSKGELDPDNCRLLFDLTMKSLGSTIVDVQVVDKIVSLNLWNNHPAMPELMESSRVEMTEALRQAGYQLLTLRSTPLPDREAAGSTAAQTAVHGGAPAEWSAKPYKGVDFRV